MIRWTKDVFIYNYYALEAGFGIREYIKKKCSDGDCLVSKEFVCCKQSKKRVDANLKPNRQGRKGGARSDCKAKIALYKGISHEKFVVVVFNE